ncbi:hypothetical protein [Staphylococcus equorum]|uniref:Uncharacterized protein n=1 Tax=Staphylococcus equorum TaxID=246432 RepID=A0AAP7IG27_9STAP|nr:hypothetical protein [Staphylococcus equorum]OEK58941.1 hypothetical protein ASS94_01040 [Staphylococcus equorum]
MTNLTIYYIKDIKGNVVYTNTNEVEFKQYINDYLELDLGRYPSMEDIINAVSELEIGKKQIEIEF